MKKIILIAAVLSTFTAAPVEAGFLDFFKGKSSTSVNAQTSKVTPKEPSVLSEVLEEHKKLAIQQEIEKKDAEFKAGFQKAQYYFDKEDGTAIDYVLGLDQSLKTGADVASYNYWAKAKEKSKLGRFAMSALPIINIITSPFVGAALGIAYGVSTPFYLAYKGYMAAAKKTESSGARAAAAIGSFLGGCIAGVGAAAAGFAHGIWISFRSSAILIKNEIMAPRAEQTIES